MIDNMEHKKCNGCRMCADLCPVDAIIFEDDKLNGFAYPVILKERCIGCGLCERSCPQLNPVRQKKRMMPKVYAAWSLDDTKRLICTSGGIFYELAHCIVEDGDMAVACRYTDDYKGAYHTVAKTQEDILPLCGSKYVQSDTLHIYKKTQDILKSGKKVLFVGTPCQVAALYRYLGQEPDNLLTVDFICNSINSPKSQAKYIEYLEEIYGAKVVYARAKDKRYGWNRFGSSAEFENGLQYYADRSKDARVVGYHQGHLFIRESCMDCRYKVLPRNSDLTLGDFWGLEPSESNPKLELGTSLVMVNSDKGKKAMEQLSGHIGCYEKSLEDAIRGNPAILNAVQSNGNSLAAFAALDTERFDRVVETYKTKKSLMKKLLSKGKELLVKK